MRIFHGFDALPAFRRPAATVGSFDGVHGGHKSLIGRVVAEARAQDGESIVLTFDPHPRVTLGSAEGLGLLTSSEEKAWLLEREGIDNLIIIPFDRAFSRLEPDAFIRDYLIGMVGAETLVVGYNHRFGYGKEGDYDFLNRLHRECGFRVVRVAEYNADAEKVSSTVLRGLIERGELEHAARIMSHPYILIGEAKEGMVRVAEPLKLLPPPGVYPVYANGREALLTIDAGGCMRILCGQTPQAISLWKERRSLRMSTACVCVREPMPATTEREARWPRADRTCSCEESGTDTDSKRMGEREIRRMERTVRCTDGQEICGGCGMAKNTGQPEDGPFEGKIVITFCI